MGIFILFLVLEALFLALIIMLEWVNCWEDLKCNKILYIAILSVFQSITSVINTIFIDSQGSIDTVLSMEQYRNTIVYSKWPFTVLANLHIALILPFTVCCMPRDTLLRALVFLYLWLQAFTDPAWSGVQHVTLGKWVSTTTFFPSCGIDFDGSNFHPDSCF